MPLPDQDCYWLPGSWKAVLLANLLKRILKDLHPQATMFFEISLAQWSLHKAFFAGEIDPVTFPTLAREEFGIGGVEYVNQFFKDKALDKEYLGELNKKSF